MWQRVRTKMMDAVVPTVIDIDDDCVCRDVSRKGARKAPDASEASWVAYRVLSSSQLLCCTAGPLRSTPAGVDRWRRRLYTKVRRY